MVHRDNRVIPLWPLASVRRPLQAARVVDDLRIVLDEQNAVRRSDRHGPMRLSSALPMITEGRLLKSCAMPPVSLPSASGFRLCRTAYSAICRSGLSAAAASTAWVQRSDKSLEDTPGFVCWRFRLAGQAHSCPRADTQVSNHTLLGFQPHGVIGMRFLRVYGRVISVLGRDLRIAALLTGANVFIAALQFLDPILFGRVVNLLWRSDQPDAGSLWPQAVVLLSMWAGVGVIGIGSNIVVSVQTERLAHRNRLKAMGGYFSHVLTLPPSFHGDTHSGRLIKAMIAGSECLFGTWLVFFRDQLATLISALVLLPLTLLLNWRLGLTLITLVAVFVTVTAFVIRRTEAGQREVESCNSALAGTAQDALANVMVVQAFTRPAAEMRIFGDIAQQLIHRQFPVLNWWALVNVLTRAASTLAMITIVAIGALLHAQGKAGIGEIVSFMGFAMLLIGRMESGVSFVASLFYKLPAVEEFFSIMDAKSSVPERPDARVLWAPRGEVAFEDVSFSYPGATTVLRDLSFVAKPGTTVALVGQTGAGKSTAVALLQRLWDPDSGRITIDGQDLREVTLESLRAAIGVVFQESLLFNRTIRDNLRIGRPDATDEQIEHACRMADAHEFIVRQPKGYDTQVGERGVTLSGGQRQRLAIARALLKDPPILILDEATSALDAATEARVGRALKALMAGRTTFIIAHRLSTVRDADEIMVFDQGQVVERGSYAELLARKGRFAELVATQLAPPAELMAAG
jgi:ATP-binding cassette subfamily B protein